MAMKMAYKSMGVIRSLLTNWDDPNHTNWDDPNSNGREFMAKTNGGCGC